MEVYLEKRKTNFDIYLWFEITLDKFIIENYQQQKIAYSFVKATV